MSHFFLSLFRYYWFRRIFDCVSWCLYHEKEPPIDARREIEESDWIHPKVKDFLIRHSVVVNRASTPFDEQEFIDLICQYQPEPIRQITIAYEAPPIFIRQRYTIPKGYDIYGWWEHIDPYTPWISGFTRQTDGSIGILLFMRRDIFAILQDQEYRFIRWAFDQDRRLRKLLGERGNDLGPLAMVGILPWYILKRREKFSDYPEYIHMCEEKNQNSARFVVEATRQILEEANIASENLVVLGSHGSLGKVVREYFPDSKGIDLGNIHDFPRSGRYLILDCTVGNTLEKYLKWWFLTEKIEGIWLNEAYPPPHPNVIKKVPKTLEIRHILGVEWEVIPSLPWYYHNAIPCCMWLLDQDVKSVKVIGLERGG